MPNFGKPNATGRSSGKRTGKEKRHLSPPKGEAWVWLTCEMLSSDAWRGLSVNARRLIDRLMIEHANHAGKENGELIVTYDQLCEYGLTSDAIKMAIDQAEDFGFIKTKRGGRWASKNTPSKYRLTWIGDKFQNQPTNEWKRFTKEGVTRWKHERRQSKQAVKAYRERNRSHPRDKGYHRP